MILVDSHAHLDSAEFAADLPEVIERATGEGVKTVLTVGCLNAEVETWARILDILDHYPSVFAAFGIHPHDAADFSESLERRLEDLMTHPRVLGLGEIGLDLYYEHSPFRTQIEVFRQQLSLAKKSGKPVIIHTRDASDETREVLLDSFASGDQDSGVLHCYTGSKELAREGLERGFYLGFGGILTFKKSDELRCLVAGLPADRLLIETDCPYLAPAPRRGKRNEPAYVAWVAEEMARVRKCSLEEIALNTTRNFCRLFNIELALTSGS
jgi:TatD DNase family protein